MRGRAAVKDCSKKSEFDKKVIDLLSLLKNLFLSAPAPVANPISCREVRLSVVSYLTNSIVDQILQELYATHKTLVSTSMTHDERVSRPKVCECRLRESVSDPTGVAPQAVGRVE